MAVIDIYSKRQKRLAGDAPDVYKYDQIPRTLRVQIIHIWREVLGTDDQIYTGHVAAVYSLIVNSLRREYGVFALSTPKSYGEPSTIQELTDFLLEQQNTAKVLDAIELSFTAIDLHTRNYHYIHRHNGDDIANNAIDELNRRFKEHGIGYQFTNRQIIRIDSEFIHSEVVKEALRLLNKKEYAGAQDEFLKAHAHYRSQNSKEALNECLKSFESLMKSICDKRGWNYASNATAKNLIQACLDNGLIPRFWQQNFSSLRSLLESSVPTGRNKLGGHGQGSSLTTVPDHLVAYMLHMTASSLVFLAEADAALP